MNGRMQSQRSWVISGIAVAVVIALGSWFFLINPERSSTNSLHSQAADTELQNDLLAAKVASLRKQNDKLDELNRTLATKLQGLPAEPEVQEYTRQLITQSALSQVSLAGIVAGSPTVGSASLATGSAAVANPAGKLFTIPLSVTTFGSLQQQRNLLAAIQKVGPRRGLITAVEFTPVSGTKGASSSSVDTIDQMVTQISIFVAPQTPAEEAALEKQVAGH